VETARILSSLLNAVNLRMHQVAAETRADEWRRRAAPGTNLLAFTFWHVARALDADVNMGLRGARETAEDAPWRDQAWMRPGVGVGYTCEQADDLARLVEPEQVLEYADAVRASISRWLKEASEETLDEANSFIAHAAATPAYAYPAFAREIAWMEGRPVWAVLAIAVFAHSWAHLAEMETVRTILRSTTQ
jgi:hypothetical protein